MCPTGEQQEELEQLRDILEEQKAEIIRLSELLDKAGRNFESLGKRTCLSKPAHWAPRPVCFSVLGQNAMFVAS